MKIDDLPIHMRLKGRKCRKKINGFEYAGFALRVFTHKQNSPPWNFHIQAGETAKVGEREMFEIHGRRFEG